MKERLLNSLPEPCTARCAAMPDCTVCHKQKKPQGRSVPLPLGFVYCGEDCEGYRQEPRVGHLWPEELCEETT